MLCCFLFFTEQEVVEWTVNVTDAAPGPVTISIVDGNPPNVMPGEAFLLQWPWLAEHCSLGISSMGTSSAGAAVAEAQKCCRSELEQLATPAAHLSALALAARMHQVASAPHAIPCSDQAVERRG